MRVHLVRRLTAAGVSLSMALAPLTAFGQGDGFQTGGLLKSGDLLTSGDAGQGVTVVQPGGDPPARVGRLAAMSGTVSYHLADADRWERAQINLPVTTGSAFWTEPGGQAVVEAAGTRIVLDQSTELEMRTLDDHALVAALPQGRAYVHMQRLGAGDSASVQTPRGSVLLLRAGRYEVAAGDTGAPTVVTVLDGEAEVTLAGAIVHVGPNEAATITGDGQGMPLEARLGAPASDPFRTARLNEERPVRRLVVAPPAEVAQMTGGAELEQYGDWASTPEYGPVWYPPAGPEFVPYRLGRWAFVQPWGWTWVDDAPWGFAPSHYGRWAEVNDRWGWIPGQPGGFGYPVYAPAVVSFLAGPGFGGPGFAVPPFGGPGFAVPAFGGPGFGGPGFGGFGGFGFGAVGWVPLGPREAYYPPYRVSDVYVRNLNVTHVQNISNVVTTYNTQVINNQTGALPPGGLMNRAGATVVPAAAMAGSQTLAGVVQPLPAGGLPAGAGAAVRPSVMPTQTTLGVTPVVAQQMRLPAGGSGPGRPGAPGPALRAGLPPGAGVPGAGVTGAGVPGAGLPGAGLSVGAGLGAGAAVGSPPGGIVAQPGGPVGATPGGSAGLTSGVLGGAAAGAVAGSLLRPGPGLPAGPGGGAGLPTVARPGGVPPVAAGVVALPPVAAGVVALPPVAAGVVALPPVAAGALPPLRQPGSTGGSGPNGGAPGPTLPPRTGVVAPSMQPGSVPRVPGGGTGAGLPALVGPGTSAGALPRVGSTQPGTQPGIQPGLGQAAVPGVRSGAGVPLTALPQGGTPGAILGSRPGADLLSPSPPVPRGIVGGGSATTGTQVPLAAVGAPGVARPSLPQGGVAPPPAQVRAAPAPAAAAAPAMPLVRAGAVPAPPPPTPMRAAPPPPLPQVLSAPPPQMRAVPPPPPQMRAAPPPLPQVYTPPPPQMRAAPPPPPPQMRATPPPLPQVYTPPPPQMRAAPPPPPPQMRAAPPPAPPAQFRAAPPPPPPPMRAAPPPPAAHPRDPRQPNG